MEIITPATCRAARALIDMTQQQLAQAARVGLSTVKAYEIGRTVPLPNNLTAIRAALEAAGIEFIPENGGGGGVRLRNGASLQAERVYRSVGPESEVRGGPEAAERPEIETDD